MMTLEASIGWRPDIQGWSRDILPFYDRIAEELPDGADIAEVGVYQGRSLVFLAQKMRSLGKRCTIIGVDNWVNDGDLLECRKWVREFDPKGEMITLIVGDSASMAIPWGVTFDVVFVDADHSSDGVARDIDAWRHRVIEGGILAGHDYCPQFPGVKEAVDAAFPSGVMIEDTVWSVRL